MALILGSIVVDRKTKEVLLSCKILARIEGFRWSSSYVGKQLLDGFSKDVFGIEYSDWSYVNAECRRLVNINMPLEVWELWLTDMKDTGPRVDLVTGRPIDVEYTKATLREMARNAVKWMNLDAVRVMEHLNRPSDFFDTVKGRIPEAMKRMSEGLHNVRHCSSILRKLGIYGQPVYGPSAYRRTVRLFDQLVGLGLLPSELREVLFRDCTEVDLVAAHFFINAFLWGLIDVQDWLNHQGDIWDAFIAYVHAPKGRYTQVKKALKDIFYALFYGKQLSSVIRDGRRALASLGCTQDLFSHPIVTSIITAREVEFAKIAANGGATDVYGKFIPLTRSVNERSVMAQVAQAVELYLMQPVVEVAEATKEFEVVLWLHDGCIVNFHQNKAQNLAKIEAAIHARARSIGMTIKIRTKELTGVSTPALSVAASFHPSTAFTRQAVVPAVVSLPGMCNTVIDQNLGNYVGIVSEIKARIEADKSRKEQVKTEREIVQTQLEQKKAVLQGLYAQITTGQETELQKKIAALKVSIARLEKKLDRLIKSGSKEWYADLVICVPNQKAKANLAEALGWVVDGYENPACSRIKTHFELGLSYTGSRWDSHGVRVPQYQQNKNLFNADGKTLRKQRAQHILFPFRPEPEVLNILMGSWADDAVIWILHDNLTTGDDHDLRVKTPALDSLPVISIYEGKLLPSQEIRMRFARAA